MNTRKLWTWMVLLASFTLVLQVSTEATAQDDAQNQNQDQNQSQDQDPPGRVARLNFSDGSISFRPAGEDDWVSGVPTRPMVTGDDLWADEDSRAEVHIGSTAIRLGAKTGITFLNLDDHTTQIRLAQGSLILRVRHVDDDDNYEIDTPNIAFSLLQPGEYRVDVSEDGSQSSTTVWHGRGRVTGGGFTYTVVADQSATFTGSDHLDYELAQVPDRDDFDTWAFERDDSEDRADSANYVSREMTGYEDLDEYGDWSYVAGYGPCWAAARRRVRMGSLSLRSLGLCWPVGLDLDRRRALGIRSLPLRALGVRRQRLVLGSWTGRCPSDLGAGAGGIRGRRSGFPLLRRRWRGMVPARSGRSLSPRIPREPRIHKQGERH